MDISIFHSSSIPIADAAYQDKADITGCAQTRTVLS